MSFVHFRPGRIGLLLLLLASVWLAGCDELGIESASAVAAKREADGKAIGAGCRHAARSIEQCFQTNKRADRASVFAGWREMEDYMRENKIEAVAAPPEPVRSKADDEDEDSAAAEAKADKTARLTGADPPEKSAAARPAARAGT